jgi:hypothetical protein
MFCDEPITIPPTKRAKAREPNDPRPFNHHKRALIGEDMFHIFNRLERACERIGRVTDHMVPNLKDRRNMCGTGGTNFWDHFEGVDC